MMPVALELGAVGRAMRTRGTCTRIVRRSHPSWKPRTDIEALPQVPMPTQPSRWGDSDGEGVRGFRRGFGGIQRCRSVGIFVGVFGGSISSFVVPFCVEILGLCRCCCCCRSLVAVVVALSSSCCSSVQQFVHTNGIWLPH